MTRNDNKGEKETSKQKEEKYGLFKILTGNKGWCANPSVYLLFLLLMSKAVSASGLEGKS